MRYALLLMALAACGAPEELDPQPPQAAMTADGPVVVARPGWNLHWYPALCVVAVRDADGGLHECHPMFPPCTPARGGGCGALGSP